MTTPTGQSQRQYLNAISASIVTYMSLPDRIPTNVRNAAVVTAAASAIAVPESQQLNLRLITSFVGGAGLAWRLLPDDTSVKSLAVSTLFAGSTLFMGQYILEQQFVPSAPVHHQTQPAGNHNPSPSLILSALPSALQLLFAQNQGTQNLASSTPPIKNPGPQTVAVTAMMQQQREAVNNRV